MNEQVSVLFRELADLLPAEREAIFAARNIAPHLRAEVESLLACDVTGHAITECIGAAAQAAASAPAETCGPYRLLRLIGSGGMGTVYLAERDDGEIHQRVAIKMLHAGADRASWQERFLRERQLLASLNHPSVARVFDAGHIDRGRPYLVMEYIEGRPIDCAAETMPLREQLALFLKVCDGVAHAHRRLIIHRDLKPSNILVDAAGQPKLLDFGIAKLLDETADQTQTAERLLTPGYASPEQLRGTLQTTAADIYSLGAVLYKILTGRSPHESESGELQAIEIVAGTRHVPPPRRLNPAIPTDIDSILQKTLRLQPEERYASVEALAADVRAFLDSKPVHARAGDAWYRARKFLRRRWLPVAAASVALAGLSIGFYAANRQRAIAQSRFVQVRQLAGKWIDLDHDIRNLRNPAKARARIVSTMLEYLAGIGPQARSDPDLAIEIADAYLQVGCVQGVPTESNLGQFAQAEDSLRKADEFADGVLRGDASNRNALRISASVAYNRLVLAGLQDRYQDSITQAAKALAQFDRLKTVAPLAPEQQRLYDDASRRRRQAIEIARKVEAGAGAPAFVVPRAVPHPPADSLLAWGYNEYGQLGNGASVDSDTASHVLGLDKVVSLSAGWAHTLALRSDGTVWAWGRNSMGQLGTGSKIGSLRPIQIPGLTHVIAIASGFEHGLAIKTDGAAWAWGANYAGQLGNGKKLDSVSPVRVMILEKVTSVAGGGMHSVAATSDGAVWAWGYNSDGQIGNDGPDTAVPARVSGIDGAIAVAAGGAHSLALRSDGTVWAWGFNNFGQAGNGSNINGFTPIRVAGLSKVVAVAAGDLYSLALKADGTVWAWGGNAEGELGNGSTTNTSVPVLISGLSDVIAISAAGRGKVGHNLALKSDGSVWSWGYNYWAELGTNGKKNSNLPVAVPGIRGAIGVAAGGGHSVVMFAK
jgi:alpha-tubulin suppressor-like RCC1 family protein/tRNA A-37 threonylcarbamoyl transferase component Bud32